MQIAPNIYRIDGTNANVYVIVNNDKVIQIDSGLKGQFDKVKQFYDSMKIKPDIVIITHSHMDHIGELARVVNEYKPEVYAHAEEIPVIAGERSMYSKSNLIKVVGAFIKPKPIKNVFDIKGLKVPNISIVETPGHTPGSISVLYENGDKRYLFVGDAAFENNGKLFVNEKYSLDVATANKSLDKILSLKPITVLPGHGNPVNL